jgi:hypothetical protein
MSAPQNRKAAAQADVARLATAISNAEAKLKSNRALIDGNGAAVSARSAASAMGQPFNGEVLSPAEIAVLEQEIEGYESASKMLTAQRKNAEADLKQANRDLRSEQASYVRTTIIPSLLQAAQDAGAEFGRALAALAAAEDITIQMGRPEGEPYTPGNASRFVNGLNSGTGSNVFFDVGPGRGVWDMPDYYPASARIKAQLLEANV